MTEPLLVSSSLYGNIPRELREYRNWVCWKYVTKPNSVKPTKVPYQLNGIPASTTSPDTWCSFDDAVKASSNFDGIGFVFTNTPYTGIDCDQTSNPAAITEQVSIIETFDTYTERSPSGQGVHAIVKGSMSINGFRVKDIVEVYSTGRYFTFTGDVYKPRPIAERSELLQSLVDRYRPNENVPTTQTQVSTGSNDDEVIKRAREATNGEKFLNLFSGRWQGEYPSQSEADFALIDIISFYTEDKAQAARIFRSSALGARDKAKRDNYVMPMITKARADKLGIAISAEVIAENSNSIEAVLKSRQIEQSISNVASNQPISNIQFPRGLVGEIAQYAYDAAPSQIPEVAISAALAVMAGICARSYNVSGTGLNLYIMMVAPSGTGKEAGGKAVTTLLSNVKRFVPNANFMGPGEIASGPALHKALAANPCFVSVFGEFGLTLQEMSSAEHGPQLSLRKELLKVFSKSGKTDELLPLVYSDKRNDTLTVESPSLTLLCESSPEVFYDNLDEGMINGGLIPRFVLFEYNEFDAPYNPNHHRVEPPKRLVEQLNSLALTALRLATPEFKIEELRAARKVNNIDITPEAMNIIEQFRLHTKDKRGVKEFTRNIWNRAHVTAWKIAGLCAIGENYLNPIIQEHNVLWACGIVDNSCSILVSKLESGNVGKNSSENKQEVHIKRVIKEYLTRPFKTIAPYSNNERLHQAKLIPHSYISRRLGAIPVFMGDRLGKTNAIKRVIKSMVDEDVLREVSRETMKNTYQTIQTCYVLQDLSIL